VRHCETLERAEALNKSKATKATVKAGKRTTAKHKHKPFTESDRDVARFNCRHHGKNKTHNTDQCLFLNKNKNKQVSTQNSAKKPFTPKNFRKEINLLSKGKKKRVLESYAAVIKDELSKNKTTGRSKNSKKQRKTRRILNKGSDSDSSFSSESVSLEDHGITQIMDSIKNKATKRTVTFDPEADRIPKVTRNLTTTIPKKPRTQIVRKRSKVAPPVETVPEDIFMVDAESSDSDESIEIIAEPVEKPAAKPKPVLKIPVLN